GAPLAVRGEDVLGLRVDGRGHVGRQRPRRRRPDHERLAFASLERETHEQGRVLELRVVLVAGLLVLRERGPAARAPLRRTVALVEPLAAMALLQEPPDVLDVRVRESEVVVAPVHPLAEALELRGLDRGVLGDEVAEARPAGVLLAQALEGPFLIPALEQLAFESRMVGYVRQRCEDLLHRPIVASDPSGNTRPPLARDHAAPGTTLALAKAISLGRGRVRPLAWCSRPRGWTALPEGSRWEQWSSAAR